jgi:predicted nucleotidyltransferase
MNPLDLTALTEALSREPGVELAMLFGSAKDGTIPTEGDVDVGVLHRPALTPLEFFALHQRLTSRLAMAADLDLVDLGRANSILAFEALCGRRLLVRDADTVAEFSSLVARQYEDDLLHAARWTDRE